MSLVLDGASTVKILKYVILKRHTLIDVAENLGILLFKLDRMSLYPQSQHLQQSNFVRMVVSTLALNFGLQPPPPTQDSCYKGLLFETFCDSDYPEERGSGRVG
ncbi:hypothetical protein ACE1AT_15610 [Pelatocladus sp. BLCC-F211]|uniref:hypothetical protein n=1 Tax=Pelatocladus sp. BLCC-F211 TaxID=3342752 RepID=UPI0035B8A00A